LRYNGLPDLHHHLRMKSIVLLLRPEADAGGRT
jgi:hypothetical protein